MPGWALPMAARMPPEAMRRDAISRHVLALRGRGIGRMPRQLTLNGNAGLRQSLMTTRTTDVLIVGSGFGAAAPALRLAQAGLRVTILEKGPATGPGDYQADPGSTLRAALPQEPLRAVGSASPMPRRSAAARDSMRWFPCAHQRLAFEQRDRFGERLWPADLDRTMLDPWYERAERMLRVSRSRRRTCRPRGRGFRAT